MNKINNKLTILLHLCLLIGIANFTGCLSNPLKENLAEKAKSNPREFLISAIAKLKESKSYKIEMYDSFPGKDETLFQSIIEYSSPDKYKWIFGRQSKALTEIIFISNTKYKKIDSAKWDKTENETEVGGEIIKQHKKENLEDLLTKTEVKF